MQPETIILRCRDRFATGLRPLRIRVIGLLARQPESAGGPSRLSRRRARRLGDVACLGRAYTKDMAALPRGPFGHGRETTDSAAGEREEQTSWTV
jgi:hypothetical protein